MFRSPRHSRRRFFGFQRPFPGNFPVIVQERARSRFALCRKKEPACRLTIISAGKGFRFAAKRNPCQGRTGLRSRMLGFGFAVQACWQGSLLMEGLPCLLCLRQAFQGGFWFYSCGAIMISTRLPCSSTDLRMALMFSASICSTACSYSLSKSLPL